MTQLFADQALLPDGWAANLRIVTDGGTITRVERNAARAPGEERVAILVPAMPNLHSHAFQRGMAGLAETRGPGDDSFWSWREVMYRFALTMTPDQVEAVAAQLYVEMLEAGFARVGEFHYLHHDMTGGPMPNIAEMAERIAAAARRDRHRTDAAAGVLRAFGFGGRRRPKASGGSSTMSMASRACLRKAVKRGGVDAMSRRRRRAAQPAGGDAGGTGGGHGARRGGPVHIHAAEQTREVEDCIAWSGARPVEWLLDNADVDARWCLIHATHMTEAETDAAWRRRRGRRALPDHRGQSRRRHVSRPAIPCEWRPLRHRLGFQRADRRARRTAPARIFAAPAASPAQCPGARRAARTAARCSTRQLAGGNKALGGRPAGIASGGAAGFVSLDNSHPSLAGKDRGRDPRCLDFRQRQTGRLRVDRRQEAGSGGSPHLPRSHCGTVQKGHDGADRDVMETCAG